MQIQEKLCLTLFNKTNDAKREYNIKIKTELKNKLKIKIKSCLNVFSDNGYYDAIITLYLCKEYKKCESTDILYYPKSNGIQYNIKYLNLYKMHSSNLFDDVCDTFRNLLINEGFRIGKDNKKINELSEKLCEGCKTICESRVDIHIYWDSNAASKINNKREILNEIEDINNINMSDSFSILNKTTNTLHKLYIENDDEFI